MDTRHNHQGTLFLFLSPEAKEEKMIQRFHGIDRHKRFSTISVLNREGQEIQFLSACYDLRKYIEDLGPEDAVILEASSGAFWWADRIEAKGSACYILDPHKFRIIKDSWKKTDKYDSRNMVKALWVYLETESSLVFRRYQLVRRWCHSKTNRVHTIAEGSAVIALIMDDKASRFWKEGAAAPGPQETPARDRLLQQIRQDR
jgi:hypothetical protein